MSADVRAMLAALAALDGLRVDGACAECDAYTEMSADDDGVYVATVRHDDWCPDLARRRRTQR